MELRGKNNRNKKIIANILVDLFHYFIIEQKLRKIWRHLPLNQSSTRFRPKYNCKGP